MSSTFWKHTVIEDTKFDVEKTSTNIEDTKFDVEKTSTNDHISSHRRQY